MGQARPLQAARHAKTPFPGISTNQTRRIDHEDLGAGSNLANGKLTNSYRHCQHVDFAGENTVNAPPQHRRVKAQPAGTKRKATIMLRRKDIRARARAFALAGG